LKQREKATLVRIKGLEDELRRSTKAYEEIERELSRAKNREEGMLKALGSTLKDTI